MGLTFHFGLAKSLYFLQNRFRSRFSGHKLPQFTVVTGKANVLSRMRVHSRGVFVKDLERLVSGECLGTKPLTTVPSEDIAFCSKKFTMS